eukprot:12428498-Heterocapsa_arctica.AAC.1
MQHLAKTLATYPKNVTCTIKAQFEASILEPKSDLAVDLPHDLKVIQASEKLTAAQRRVIRSDKAKVAAEAL